MIRKMAALGLALGMLHPVAGGAQSLEALEMQYRQTCGRNDPSMASMCAMFRSQIDQLRSMGGASTSAPSAPSFAPAQPFVSPAQPAVRPQPQPQAPSQAVQRPAQAQQAGRSEIEQYERAYLRAWTSAEVCEQLRSEGRVPNSECVRFRQEFDRLQRPPVSFPATYRTPSISDLRARYPSEVQGRDAFMAQRAPPTAPAPAAERTAPSASGATQPAVQPRQAGVPVQRDGSACAVVLGARRSTMIRENTLVDFTNACGVNIDVWVDFENDYGGSLWTNVGPGQKHTAEGRGGYRVRYAASRR